MASRNDGLGNHPIIVIIGLVAACIGIFVFATGYENIGQILKNLFSSSSPPGIPTSTVPTKTLPPTPTEVKAIAGNWAQVGLAGDTVSDLIFANNTLYVATNDQLHGVFKSVDGGTNWAAINNGLGDLNVNYLVVAPNDNNIVYASTRNGVWRTSDAGKTWFPVDAPDSVITIASDNGEILYAAKRYVEIWQSQDGGTSWDMVTRNFGWCNLMYSPSTNRNILYCLQTYTLGGAQNTIPNVQLLSGH